MSRVTVLGDRLRLLLMMAPVAAGAEFERALTAAFEEAAASEEPEERLLGRLGLATDNSVPVAELAARILRLIPPLDSLDPVGELASYVDAASLPMVVDAVLNVLTNSPKLRTDDALAGLLAPLSDGPAMSAAQKRLVDWMLAGDVEQLERRIPDIARTAFVLGQSGQETAARSLREMAIGAAEGHPAAKTILTAVGQSLGSWYYAYFGASRTTALAAVEVLQRGGHFQGAESLLDLIVEELESRMQPRNAGDAVDLLQAASGVAGARPDLARRVLTIAAAYLARRGELVQSVGAILSIIHADQPRAQVVWEALDGGANVEVVAVVAAWAARGPDGSLPEALTVPPESLRSDDPLAWTIALACIAEATSGDESQVLVRRALVSCLQLDPDLRHEGLSLIAKLRRVWPHDNGIRNFYSREDAIDLGTFLAGLGATADDPLMNWLDAGTGREEDAWNAVAGFIKGADGIRRERVLDHALERIAGAEAWNRRRLVEPLFEELARLGATEYLVRLRKQAGTPYMETQALTALLERDEDFRASWEAAGLTEAAAMNDIQVALGAGNFDRAVALAEEEIRSGVDFFDGLGWVNALSWVIRATEVGRLELRRDAGHVLSGMADEDARDLATVAMVTADCAVGSVSAEVAGSRLTEILVGFRVRENAEAIVIMTPGIIDAFRDLDLEMPQAMIEIMTAAIDGVEDDFTDEPETGEIDAEDLLAYAFAQCCRARLRILAGDVGGGRDLLGGAQAAILGTALTDATSDDYIVWLFAVSELARAWRAVGDIEAATALVRRLASSRRPWFDLTSDDDIDEVLILAESILISLVQLGVEAVPVILGMLRDVRDQQVSLCPILACLALQTLGAVGEREAVDAVARTLVALADAGTTSP